jgi:hypothetical protein
MWLRNWNSGKQNRDDTEVLQLRKVPLEQAVQMAMRSEITDAISVAGLLAINNLDV